MPSVRTSLTTHQSSRRLWCHHITAWLWTDLVFPYPRAPTQTLHLHQSIPGSTFSTKQLQLKVPLTYPRQTLNGTVLRTATKINVAFRHHGILSVPSERKEITLPNFKTRTGHFIHHLPSSSDLWLQVCTAKRRQRIAIFFFEQICSCDPKVSLVASLLEERQTFCPA